MNLIGLRLFFWLTFLSCLNVRAQISDQEAKIYFSKYASKNAINELILKSFPSIIEARKLFKKEEDALQFMRMIEALEKKMKASKKEPDEAFSDVEISSFTVKEVSERKANFNLGLLEIIDKLQPAVKYYTVKMMRTTEFQPGFSYIYWTNINGKWFFISKPNIAFKKG